VLFVNVVFAVLFIGVFSSTANLGKEWIFRVLEKNDFDFSKKKWKFLIAVSNL
jgi:hypothetical protein